MNGKYFGFTLIELLVVMVIIATLVMIVAPRYLSSVEHSEEVALTSNLKNLRDLLDQFYADRGNYPSSIQDMVDRNYLRVIPTDPITKSTETWVVSTDRGDGSEGIWDIHSGAPGETRDGILYSEL